MILGSTSPPTRIFSTVTSAVTSYLRISNVSSHVVLKYSAVSLTVALTVYSPAVVGTVSEYSSSESVLSLYSNVT